MNEVYQNSQNLTDEQKRIADYWADCAGTVTPPGHWNVIAMDLLRDADWSTLGRRLNGSFGLFPAQDDELDAMAEEAAISRLYGGIHYRSDNEVGFTLGKRVGQVAVQAYHVPSP